MQCYCAGARYGFIEDVGYVYRRNEASVSYRYDPDCGKCWLGIAGTLKKWLKGREGYLSRYEDLIWYTILFASFFDAKAEYQKGKPSVWRIRKILKLYGQDKLAKESFAKLAAEKRNLQQGLWRIMVRGFSVGMKLKCYLSLAFGIKILVNNRVDERLSDTGLRE